MIHTRGIVHFTIAVSDIGLSERFYRELLGLTVVRRIPSTGMVFMKCGEDYLILAKSKTAIAPNPGTEVQIHHAFHVDVDHYDESIAFLEAQGIEIIHEEDRREGVFIGRQAYFHDPDRNVLEIIALERVG